MSVHCNIHTSTYHLPQSSGILSLRQCMDFDENLPKQLWLKMSKWSRCQQLVFRDMRKNMKQGDFFFQICNISEFILIAQENYVLDTFFYIFAIDLLKKSILQLTVTQYIKFGIKLMLWILNHDFWIKNMLHTWSWYEIILNSCRI